MFSLADGLQVVDFTYISKSQIIILTIILKFKPCIMMQFHMKLLATSKETI